MRLDGAADNDAVMAVVSHSLTQLQHVSPLVFAWCSFPLSTWPASASMVERLFREGSGGQCLKATGRNGYAVSGEAIVHRPDRRLGAVVDVDLAQQGLQVDLDGCFRDVELVGDHLVAGAGHQRLEDFLLA